MQGSMLKMISSAPVAGYDKKYDEGKYEHDEGCEYANLHHQLATAMGVVVLIMLMLHHHPLAHVCMRVMGQVMVLMFCQAEVAVVKLAHVFNSMNKDISFHGIFTWIGSCFTKRFRTFITQKLFTCMVFQKGDAAISLHHVVKCSISTRLEITHVKTIQLKCPSHIFTRPKIT